MSLHVFFMHAALIASIVWGPTGCQAPVQQKLAALPPDVLGVAADPCNILYRRTHHWSWPDVCTVTIHEWGHLTGHGHSSNRRSVMYYRFNHVDSRCRHFGRPYLRQHVGSSTIRLGAGGSGRIVSGRSRPERAIRNSTAPEKREPTLPVPAYEARPHR